MNSRTRLTLILFLSFSVSSCAFSQGYREGVTGAKEAGLKAHLQMMREGIRNYTNGKGQPPRSLKELVDAGYVSYIPTDPITNEIDWVVVGYDCSAPPNCKKGIKDVHSASTEKSSHGNTYAEW